MPGAQRIKYGAFFLRDSRIEYGRPSGWVATGTHVALSSDRLLLTGKTANEDPAHLYELQWRTGELTALTHDAAELQRFVAGAGSQDSSGGPVGQRIHICGS